MCTRESSRDLPPCGTWVRSRSKNGICYTGRLMLVTYDVVPVQVVGSTPFYVPTWIWRIALAIRTHPGLRQPPLPTHRVQRVTEGTRNRIRSYALPGPKYKSSKARLTTDTNLPNSPRAMRLRRTCTPSSSPTRPQCTKSSPSPPVVRIHHLLPHGIRRRLQPPARIVRVRHRPALRVRDRHQQPGRLIVIESPRLRDR